MRYQEGYDRLAAACEDPQRIQPATLADVLRFTSEDWSDLSLPIGEKLQVATTFNVAAEAGDLAVSTSAAVIMIDRELIGDTIPKSEAGVDALGLHNHRMKPKEYDDTTMLTKATLHWGVEDLSNTTIIVHAVSPKILAYHQARIDAGERGRVLVSRVITEAGGERVKQYSNAQTAQLDAVTAAIPGFDQYNFMRKLFKPEQRLPSSYCLQTPAEFNAYAEWLVGMPGANPNGT